MRNCVLNWISGFSLAAIVISGLAGCGGSGGGSGTQVTLYSMSNSASGNRVVAWRVNGAGDLSSLGQFATNGNGVGTAEVPGSGPLDGVDPLASQGSVSLSSDKRFLYAVNAGSGTVSSFNVRNNGSLQFLNAQSTGGTSPVSVAANANRAYVVNVNAPGVTAPTITGYTVNANGSLSLIAGSTRALSNIAARPSQVLISEDGTLAIVPERGTDTINVFPINNDGTLGTPVVTNSAGPGPFGAMIDGNVLIVSEVAGGAANASSTSSYTINADGSLTVISAAVPSGETAACWVSLVPGGDKAYVTNTASASVSTYDRTSAGVLGASPVATSVNDALSQPIDAAISSDGQHFYQLLGARGTIAVFDVDAQGALTLRAVQGSGVLPTLGSQGLAIR